VKLAAILALTLLPAVPTAPRVQPLPDAQWSDVQRELVKTYARDQAVPNDVTADNYRGWFLVHIRTEEEDAFLTDIEDLANLYAVAVTTPEGERIGYLRFGD